MRLTYVVLMIALTCASYTYADTLPPNAQAAIDAFDIERAFISDKQMFVPFPVEETELLSDALTAGRVTGDMNLLILEKDDVTLSFLVQQLAYHHVAQGEIDGEPWMVSF